MDGLYSFGVSGAMECDSKKYPHVGVRAVQHKEHLHSVWYFPDGNIRGGFITVREHLTFSQARRLCEKLRALDKTFEELEHQDILLEPIRHAQETETIGRQEDAPYQEI